VIQKEKYAEKNNVQRKQQTGEKKQELQTGGEKDKLK
jgi:hypothetical protein